MSKIAGLTPLYELPYYQHKRRIYNTEGHSWSPTGPNIQRALDDLIGLGGGVYVPPRRTYTLTEDLEVPANVVLESVGRSAILNQTGAGENVITFLGNEAGIKNFRLQLPTVNSGHGINSEGRDGIQLENLRIIGIDSTHYGIRFVDGFHPDFRYIDITTNGHGIGLITSATGIYNYGNGVLDSILISMAGPGNNTVGLNIEGFSLARLMNLLTLNKIDIATGAAHANTMTGLRARYSSFLDNREFSAEGVDNGIDMEYAIDNFFSDIDLLYTTNSIILGTGAYRNYFYGGYVPETGTIVSGVSAATRLFNQNTFHNVRNTWRHERWKVCEWYDDFLGDSLDARWNVAAGVAAVQNLEHGVMRLTTGAVIGNTAILNFGGFRPLNRAMHIAQEFKIRRVEGADQSVAFGVYDGDITAANHTARFEVNWFQGNWWAVTSDSVAENWVDTGVTRSASFHTHRIEEYDDWIYFFIDGVLVATSVANLPGVAINREPFFYIRTNVDDVKNLDVDYARYATGRDMT